MITDTDIDWVDLADDIRHEYFVVDNLRPSHGYKFRVLARNKFGWSIPSIPSPIVMTPSTGASKAEFYDALQALQVRKKICKIGIQIRNMKMVFNIYGTWRWVTFEKLMMKIDDFFYSAKLFSHPV